jgi:TonB family protein
VRAIDLYKQGRDQEAIALLRQVVKQDKADISAWHYLGLAYNRQGNPGEAQKAHEKAAKTGESVLLNLFEVAGDEDIQARLAPLKSQLDEAAASADKYLELVSNSSTRKRQEWSARAAFLREMSGSYPAGQTIKDRIYLQNEVTVKARILRRAEPFYTERARENGTRGQVILKLILGADSKVRVNRIVKSLPDGLTAQAIRAAHGIKFIPALKDGQPVSQLVQVEYGFNIY